METDNDESAMNFREIGDEFQRISRFFVGELRRIRYMRTSENSVKAKFAGEAS